jgi:hypothetical protein
MGDNIAKCHSHVLIFEGIIPEKIGKEISFYIKIVRLRS